MSPATSGRGQPIATAPVQSNPFPGLRPFREDEEYLFFGRESQVDAMVDKLAATRFLTVVGTSGSGKSSLVNCGLRPALRGGLMARAGTAWRMAQFRPGSDPLRAMVDALASDEVLFRGYEAGGLTLAEIVDTTLRMSKLGLIDIYEQAQLGEDVNLLVVVDQFEELFRYRQLRAGQHENVYGASEAATAFVNLLLEAKEHTTCPIYVVLTMRSDFLGDCTQFTGLAEAINAGQYLVPRMTRDERRASITGPVGVGRAEITPVLLTRLVNDVGDNPDQLSILQHAINRTWARWQNEGGSKGPLDLAHYEAIGAMAHALDQHAERAYAELDTARKQKLCEKIFKALTDKATDPRGVRRPSTLGTLCALTDETAAEVTAVIDVFRRPSRSFVMPPAGEALQTETVIDISHESLMRVWQRLNTWADEEAQSAQRYRRLSETAAAYTAGQAGLLLDPELQLSLDWKTAANPNAAWAGLYGGAFATAISFLNASKAAQDEEHRLKEALEQYELVQAQALAVERATSARRLRIGLAFTAILAVVATVASVLAVRARQAAENATIVRRISQANTEFQISPTRGLLLAVEALNASRRDRLTCARNVTCVQAASSALVGLLSRAGGQPLIGSGDPVMALSFSRDGTLVAMSERSKLSIWRIDQLKPSSVALITTLQNQMSAVSFNREGTLLAAAGFGQVDLWPIDHARTPSPLKLQAGLGEGANFGVTSTSFSSDGRLVLTAAGTGARVWQLDHLEDHRDTPLAELSLGGGIVAASFTSDGKSVLTASAKGQVQQWKVDPFDPQPALVADLKSEISAGSFSADGTHLLISRPLKPESLRSTARIVALGDPATYEDTPVVEPFTMNPLPLRAASLSADGALVVTVDDGWTVRVWRAQNLDKPLATLRGHEGSVYAVSFSADGKLVATGGADGTARIWRLDQPMAIADGARSSDWIARLDALIELAGKTAGRNLTNAEWLQFFPDEPYHPTFRGLPAPTIEKRN